MRFFILFVLLFLGFRTIYSQNEFNSANKPAKVKKKDGDNTFKKNTIFKEIKSYYKSKNYNKTNDIILNTYKLYPEAKNDIDFVGYEMNTQYQLYLEENRKLYLNNKGDTIKLFSFIYKTYECGLRCDSLRMIPNKKGKLNSKYLYDVNNHLSFLRNNLKSGGFFFLKNKKYSDALPFFKMYLNTLNNPIVYKTKNEEILPDSDTVRIYKMALHAAYGAKEYSQVIKYLPIALSDTVRKDVMLEMGAESALQLNDSATFVRLLNDGFDEYPSNDYFSANLIKLYHDHNDFNNTMRILDKRLEIDSLAIKYLKLKGNEYYAIDSIDAAIPSFKKTVDLEPDDTETLLKLGSIYIRKARIFYNQANLKIGSPDFSKNRKHLTELYTTAMGYYERVRQIRPQNPEMWKSGLREAYYKLNKGEELKLLESVR